MSPATSRRHNILTFEKRLKMLPPMALSRILVARRFASPNQLVGFFVEQNARGALPYILTRVRRCRRHHKVRVSNISRKVWPRIDKFYMDIIDTNPLYNQTGYDVTVEWVDADVRIKFGYSISQTVLEIFDDSKRRTMAADAGHDIREKSHSAFCLTTRPNAIRCSTFTK